MAEKKQNRSIITRRRGCASNMGKTSVCVEFYLAMGQHDLYLRIQTKLTRAYFVATGTEIEFEQDEYRIKLKDLPSDEEDPILGLTIIGLEFDGKIEYPGEGWDRHTTGTDSSTMDIHTVK